MSNLYYIYVYLDPRKPGRYKYGKYYFTYEPFYIGKGKGNRYNQHNYILTNPSYKDSNKHKINKIKKIFKETNKPPIVIKIKENLSEKEAFNLEILLIKSIGRKDLNEGVLTNLSNGGEGVEGKITTNKTKMKISKSKKGINNNPCTNKKWEEYFGKKRTKEIKSKMSKATKGRVAFNKIKLNEKTIIELYKSGISTKELGNIFNVSDTTIRNRLIKNNIKLKQRGNFQKGHTPKHKISLPINTIVKSFFNKETIKNIANKFNVAPCTIQRRLKKQNIPFFKGYTKKHQLNFIKNNDINIFLETNI